MVVSTSQFLSLVDNVVGLVQHAPPDLCQSPIDRLRKSPNLSETSSNSKEEIMNGKYNENNEYILGYSEKQINNVLQVYYFV